MQKKSLKTKIRKRKRQNEKQEEKKQACFSDSLSNHRHCYGYYCLEHSSLLRRAPDYKASGPGSMHLIFLLFFFSLSLSLSLSFFSSFPFVRFFLFLCRFFSLFWQKYVYWDHRVICINANALLIANIVVNTQSNWYLTITYQQKYITLFTSNCMAFQPFRTWKNPQYPP